MPQTPWLVPGFGAQGGTIESIRPCFTSATGSAVVNASRSVIYAYESKPGDWRSAIGAAAAEFNEQLRAVGI
jgi:orotidine-5'-phosphate decarboxylase